MSLRSTPRKLGKIYGISMDNTVDTDMTQSGSLVSDIDLQIRDSLVYSRADTGAVSTVLKPWSMEFV